MKFPFMKKKGVLVTGLNPVFSTQPFIDAIVDSFRMWSEDSEGYQPTVTSGTDGKHSRWSEHYKGNALDFRVYDITPYPLINLDLTFLQLDSLCIALIVSLKKRCPEFHWHIVLHKTHIHLQTSGKNIKLNSKRVYK